MKREFYKYQGTGNDFMILDQTMDDMPIDLDTEQVARICDRRFGVGADGLMIIRNSELYDFEMVYFNADGRLSTMCGNGGRCIAHLAHELGISKEEEFFFEAMTDRYFAKIDKAANIVMLQMGDVSDIDCNMDRCILDTGSPHFVSFVEDLTDIDVYSQGRAIRYSNQFREEGINVNFVEKKSDGSIEVATYERGVENETLSCGTGVTAAALAYTMKNNVDTNTIKVITKGGNLSVSFDRQSNGGFQNIWLEGPAEETFRGVIDLNHFKSKS